MNAKARIYASLSRWHDAMCELSRQSEALAALTDAAPESPLMSAINRAMGAYTEATADAVEWDNDALLDWWLAHDFGAKPMFIGFKDEPMREISTVAQLADFIYEDLQRSVHD